MRAKRKAQEVERALEFEMYGKGKHFPESKQKVVAGSEIKRTTCRKWGPEEKRPVGTNRNHGFLRASIAGGARRAAGLRFGYFGGRGRERAKAHARLCAHLPAPGGRPSPTQRLGSVRRKSTCATAEEPAAPP